MSDLAPSVEALRSLVRDPNDCGSLEETVRKAVATLYVGRGSLIKYRSLHEHASEVQLALAGRHINALRAGGSQTIYRLGRDALEASLKRIAETSPVLRSLTPRSHRILITELSSETTMLREASIHAPHPHALTFKNTAHSLYTLFAAFSLDSTGGQVIDAWVTSSLKSLMEKVACILYTHDGWKAQADPELGALLLAPIQRAASCALPASSAPLPNPVEAMPEAPIVPAPAPACPAPTDNHPTVSATASPAPFVSHTPPAPSTTPLASAPPAPSPSTSTTPALVAPKPEYRHKRKAVQYPESSEPHKKAKQTAVAPGMEPTAGASNLKPTAGASDLKPMVDAPDLKPMAGAPGLKVSSGPYTTRIPAVLGAKRTAGTLDANRGAGGKRMPDASGMKHNALGALQGKEDTPPVAGSSSTASNPLTKPSKSKSMNLPSKLKPWRW